MSLEEQHHITKIEGHGVLNISFAQCKAKLKIEEGERLFEALLLKRPYSDGPFITSRICGVCPVAHTIASIKAMENALDIKVDENTKKLRKIMLASQIIQSHSLHLFFLALPDYIGITSAIELKTKKPELFKIAMGLKKLGDDITTIIGGRNIHPITAVVGGFTKVPSKDKLTKIKKACIGNLAAAQKTVKLFTDFRCPDITNKTQYLCMVNGQEYEVYDGKIESLNDYIFNPKNYKKEIVESIKYNSPAKFSTHNNKPFLVGALARISLHQEYLNPKAKKALAQTKIEFPSFNTFHNNLSQAIENLHFLEEIINLVDEIIADNKYPENTIIQEFKIKAGKGVGAIEAPRGTLYHYYEINSKGIIKNCDIITPTAQNLSNVEQDAQALLKIYELDKQAKNVCIHQLEMLIRAYDPCITCSVH